MGISWVLGRRMGLAILVILQERHITETPAAVLLDSHPDSILVYVVGSRCLVFHSQAGSASVGLGPLSRADQHTGCRSAWLCSTRVGGFGDVCDRDRGMQFFVAGR